MPTSPAARILLRLFVAATPHRTESGKSNRLFPSYRDKSKTDAARDETTALESPAAAFPPYTLKANYSGSPEAGSTTRHQSSTRWPRSATPPPNPASFPKELAEQN